MDSAAEAAGVAAVSLPIQSQRKEWRAVSEHHLHRSSANEVSSQLNELTLLISMLMCLLFLHLF